MRSPKSRSRGKSNRGRSPANNVNRVFDSSGPEGKVRGTPQQIIDKYLQLSRDATLSNDRVAAENFMQHAEHYVRLLAEAQRDADDKRQQAEQQNRDRQQREQQKQQEQREQEQQSAPRDDRPANGVDAGDKPAGSSDSADVVSASAEEADSGLVDTPEAKPKKTRRPRKPKVPDAATQEATSDAGE